VFRGPSLPVFLPSLLLLVASLPSRVVLPSAAASYFVVSIVYSGHPPLSMGINTHLDTLFIVLLSYFCISIIFAY